MTTRTASRRRAGLYIALVWLALAVCFAISRSIWGDELVRIHQQRMGLTGGLRALVTEPSPFAPGETILIWLSGALFGPILPLELWGRLPSVLWGFGSLLIAASLELIYLPALLFFSVALLSFSTEMRTYGSLIFAGALACKLLYDQNKPLSRGMKVLTWFTLAFTHIYGICFIGFACLLRRLWWQTALAFAYVVLILRQYHIPHRASGGTEQSYLEILKQTLGALGNPHKASLVLAPLFAFGLYRLYRRKKRLAIELVLLLAASVLGPIAATLLDRFPYLPRQTMGGLFAFVLLCALGLDEVAERLKRSPALLARGVPVALCVLAGAVPWVLCIVLRLPPFPNQPMHRFREIARQAVRDGRTSILLLDPCNEEPMAEYLEKVLGASGPAVHYQLGGIELSKRCWSGRGCLHALANFDYCSQGPDRFGPGTAVDKAIRQARPAFDLLVYSLPQAPWSAPEGARQAQSSRAARFSRSDVESVRSW